jgi:hypothetical protein
VSALVDPLTTLGLTVEVGDWQWFTGSYLGRVASEDSSGTRRM